MGKHASVDIGSEGICVCYTIINLWTGAKRCSCMHACDWMYCIHDKQAFVCTGVNCMKDLYSNIIITIYIIMYIYIG